MLGIGRDDEAVAGADLEGLAGDGEGEAAGFDEGRLDMRMVVQGADRAGLEVVRDDHQFRAVGEHLAGDAFGRGDGRERDGQAGS